MNILNTTQVIYSKGVDFLVRELCLNNEKRIYKVTLHWTWLSSEHMMGGCGMVVSRGFESGSSEGLRVRLGSEEGEKGEFKRLKKREWRPRSWGDLPGPAELE